MIQFIFTNLLVIDIANIDPDQALHYFQNRSILKQCWDEVDLCRRTTKYTGSIPCGIQRRMSHPKLLQRGFRNYFRSRMDAKNGSNITRDLSRGPWTFVFIGCGQVSRRGVVENFKVIHNKILFIRNFY